MPVELQAITWTNIDSLVSHNIASQGYIELREDFMYVNLFPSKVLLFVIWCLYINILYEIFYMCPLTNFMNKDFLYNIRIFLALFIFLSPIRFPTGSGKPGKIFFFLKSHGKSWNFEKSSNVMEISWNLENLTPINHPPALEIWHW